MEAFHDGWVWKFSGTTQYSMSTEHYITTALYIKYAWHVPVLVTTVTVMTTGFIFPVLFNPAS